MRVIAAVALVFAVVTGVLAQDVNVATNAVPPILQVIPPQTQPGTVSGVAWEAASAAVNWLGAHGNLEGGVGGSFSALGKGELSSVFIHWYDISPTNWWVKHGPAQVNCFSNEKAHTALGWEFSIPLYHFDPTVNQIQVGPLRKLADWRIGTGIAVDVEVFGDMRVSSDRLLTWLGISKKM